jgi:hypothetical protein
LEIHTRTILLVVTIMKEGLHCGLFFLTQKRRTQTR